MRGWNPLDDGAGLRVSIVAARWNETIVMRLLDGAVTTLHAQGVDPRAIAIAWVPGSFELPLAAAWAAGGAGQAVAGPPNAVVALGCVIRGETTHYDTVCEESARGLMDLTIQHDLAIGNGIITVENEDQAWVRAKPDQLDKGGGAAVACLAMIGLKRRWGIG